MTQPLAVHLKQWWFSLLILSLIIGLSELPDAIQNALELRHHPVDNGEWWRLYSSQIIHLGFNHSVLNFIGYFFLAFSFREEIPPTREIIILAVSATGVGLGIYHLNPEMHSYVGLSGAVYGILIAYVIIGVHRTPGLSLFFMAFIIIKFLSDHLSGGSPEDTEAFIGGRVAFESHYYGAFTGILPGIYFYLKDKKKLLVTDTQTFVNQFQTPIVRDLAWAIHSAPLLDIKSSKFDCISTEQCQQYAQEFLPTLKDLDRAPEPLLQAVEPDRHRLGVYFEQLLKYWLEHNEHHKLIARGVLVKQDKRTIGEFDFLLKNNLTGKNSHWEVAIKFYLALNNAKSASEFWGPGQKDRLDLKTKRLTEKQILLSDTPEGSSTLAPLGIDIQEKQLFVKGRIFYTDKRSIFSPNLMGMLSKDHIRHCWYTVSGFCKQPTVLERIQNLLMPIHYRVAEKPEWMALNSEKHISLEELINRLQQSPIDRPLLIISSRRNTEISRFFIVPDNWEKNIT